MIQRKPFQSSRRNTLLSLASGAAGVALAPLTSLAASAVGTSAAPEVAPKRGGRITLLVNPNRMR